MSNFQPLEVVGHGGHGVNQIIWRESVNLIFERLIHFTHLNVI